VRDIDGAAAPEGINGGHIGTCAGRLLTAGELAERWQVPRSQIYRLAREGRVPIVRVGRYVRFHQPTIEAFENAGGG
jgi:excisionase family DNA binding protein